MQIKQNSCYYQVYKRRKKGDKSVQVKVILGYDVTYGHKKRSTAVLQPLLTLNLIKHSAKIRTFGISANKTNKKECFITCFSKSVVFVKAY